MYSLQSTLEKERHTPQNIRHTGPKTEQRKADKDILSHKTV
jgi:hypothetical protein